MLEGVEVVSRRAGAWSAASARHLAGGEECAGGPAVVGVGYC
jgi:hypothetical protein